MSSRLPLGLLLVAHNESHAWGRHEYSGVVLNPQTSRFTFYAAEPNSQSSPKHTVGPGTLKELGERIGLLGKATHRLSPAQTQEVRLVLMHGLRKGRSTTLERKADAPVLTVSAHWAHPEGRLIIGRTNGPTIEPADESQERLFDFVANIWEQSQGFPPLHHFQDLRDMAHPGQDPDFEGAEDFFDLYNTSDEVAPFTWLEQMMQNRGIGFHLLKLDEVQTVVQVGLRASELSAKQSQTEYKRLLRSNASSNASSPARSDELEAGGFFRQAGPKLQATLIDFINSYMSTGTQIHYREENGLVTKMWITSVHELPLVR